MPIGVRRAYKEPIIEDGTSAGGAIERATFIPSRWSAHLETCASTIVSELILLEYFVGDAAILLESASLERPMLWKTSSVEELPYFGDTHATAGVS